MYTPPIKLQQFTSSTAPKAWKRCTMFVHPQDENGQT